MSFRSWWKQHFTLGIILSGALGSLVCTIFVEVIWPNTVPFLRPIGSRVWQLVVNLWSWLTATTPVSRWWYAFLLAYLAVTMLMIIAWLFRASLAPAWTEYTTDVFKGVRWRWRLNSYDGSVEDPAPFCLCCDRELKLGEGTYIREGFHEVRKTLDCRDHGPQFDFRGDVSQVIAEIEEDIRLKLRNGSWIEVVKGDPPKGT